MITVNDLLTIDIFKTLPHEKLSLLVPYLKEDSIPAGATILFRGDPGRSLFMIIEGSVEVTRFNDEGVEYTLAHLEAGQAFGEMSLLTGEPRSANVKAASPLRLLELEQEEFFKLVASSPDFSDRLIRLMVQRQASNAARNQQTAPRKKGNIATLFAEAPPEVELLTGKTKWLEQTNEDIQRLSKITSNVLILGERGTGKALAAKLIHFGGPGQAQPLYLLNCMAPPPIQRESKTSRPDKKDPLLRELAQKSALFGHCPNAGNYAQSLRRGYLELADEGSIILLNIDTLSLAIQQRLVHWLKSGSFSRIGDTEPLISKVRLLATAEQTPQELIEQGKLNPELAELLGKETLQMKPLRSRKKDIPLLADQFLETFSQQQQKELTGFSKESINQLVDHNWPLNVDGMKQTIERATILADGEKIEAEHLFLNVPEFPATGKFNLLRFSSLRKLAGLRLFPKGLQYLSVPFYLFLMIYTLWGPVQENPANLMVWAIWWPFLIFSVILTGRSWCSYCPLPFLSQCLNFNRKNVLPLPVFIKKNGRWIGVAGLAIILLAEYSTHMFTTPRATGMLLLTILAGAVAARVLFGDRSWCKYFCPLGTMLIETSPVSMIELGSNGNVCSSQCQTQDCIKEGNCPMSLHPSAATVSDDCILCLSCVKACPHRSVRINARLPWREMLEKKSGKLVSAVFTILLTALVLGVTIPGWGPVARFLKTTPETGTTGLNLLVAFCIALLFTAIVMLASGFPYSRGWRNHLTHVGPAYLFLAFSVFFNIYFHQFVIQGDQMLPWIIQQVGLAGLIPSVWVTPELGTLKMLIPLVTLAGGTGTFLMLGTMKRQNIIPRYVQRLNQIIITAATVLFLLAF